MGFIQDNFVWIIVVVIIVLMAIVGYIADKTNFGRKTVEKKENVKKVKIPMEPVVEPTAEPNIENQEEVKEDLNNIFEPVSIPSNEEENSEIDPSLFEPLPDMDMSNYDVDSDLPKIETTNLDATEESTDEKETEESSKESKDKIEEEIESDDDIWKF